MRPQLRFSRGIWGEGVRGMSTVKISRVGIFDRIVKRMSNVRYRTEKLVCSIRTTQFQEIPLETHEARIRDVFRWTKTTACAWARDTPKGTDRPCLHEAFLWSIHRFYFFLFSKLDQKCLVFMSILFSLKKNNFRFGKTVRITDILHSSIHHTIWSKNWHNLFI